MPAVRRAAGLVVPCVLCLLVFGPEAVGAEDGGTTAAAQQAQPALPGVGPELPAAGTELPAELVVSLGYGFGFPPLSTLLFAGLEPLAQGFVLDRLLKRVFIQRAVHERIALDFDYDAERGSGFMATEANTYSLEYRGPEGEVLRELSLGNRHLDIPGSRYVPMDAGTPGSFALRARAAWPGRAAGTGRASPGGWGIDGLLRYGVSLQGSRSFRGSRRVVDSELLEVAYLRARYFLLPDSGIDEASLRVYRSSDRISDLEVDGRRYALLSRSTEYGFDNRRGELALIRSLLYDEELVVYYEKAGQAVGSDALGRNAIIDETGNRGNFDSDAYPRYFDSSRTYLYLYKDGLNSYWEMRNAYPLEDLAPEAVPGGVQVSLLFTENRALNPNYASLLGNFRLDPRAGTILFDFEDAVGFYPRPFPGTFSFTDPESPDNPFDPDNPIYGGLGYPPPGSSINTLRLRYTVSTESFFLSYDLVEGSVRVTVDGLPLSPSRYAVDAQSGVITFSPGVLSPSSLVEVTYSYTPFGGGRQELLAAVGVGYAAEGFEARSLTALRYPLEELPAPYVGEEREADLRSSLGAAAAFGAPEGVEGFHARLSGEAALGARSPNPRGVAIVADMQDDRRFSLPVYEDQWLLGSRSQLLPALERGLDASRGDLLYENYWQSSLLSGEVLRELSWDNSANRRFSYTEKAGPYNTADRPSGADGRSLVLDFSFPPGAENPYAAVATAFPSANLGEYGRFNLAFRGAGISGDAVRLHVEALRVYQEDLNGNDILDGELSSLQAGFAITPLDGGPTVIGTNRFGEADGRLDSEDLNRNGYLDPLGLFALDEEQGVPLTAAGAGDAHLASLSPGEESWQVLSIDIRHLLDSHPEVFRDLRGLRLTVTPASETTPGAVTGKILLHRLWFSASGLVNNTPDALSLREVSVAEDPVVAANAFSARYPEVYEELHGRPAYRQRQGHDERVLIGRLEAPLGAGERASLSRRFGYAADLSQYREFRMYLFRTGAETYPEEAVFELSFRAGALERLDAELPGGAFRSGWNEIRVSLEGNFAVSVNGEGVGALSPTGTLAVLSRVVEVRFGVRAEGGVVPAGLVYWLDEWHLRSPRTAVQGAVSAEASAGYRGALLSVGGVPVLSDLLVGGSYEHTGGGFAGAPGWREDRYSGSLELGLLSVLSAGLSVEGAARRPQASAREGTAAEVQDFEEGRRGWSSGLRLALDPGLPYLPVLEHGYRRTESRDQGILLTRSDYELGLGETVAESLSIAGRYAPADWLSQSYSFSRSWLFEGDSRREADTGALLSLDRRLVLSQVHDAGAWFRWQGGWLSLEGRRDESLDVPGPEVPPQLLDSYAAKMAGLFVPAQRMYPEGRWDNRSDSGRVILSLPRRRYLGASLSADASYRSWNFDAIDPGGEGPSGEALTRDAELSQVLSLSLPFSPDGGGRLQLVPRFRRSFRGTYRQTQEPLTEARLLWETGRQLLRRPLYYLDPRWEEGRLNELAAVGVLSSSPEVTGSSNARLESSAAFEALVRNGPWYVPSRAGLSLGGETSREGTGYGQSRSLRGNLGFDIPLAVTARGDRLGLEAGYLMRSDYARKLRVQEVSARSSLQLAGPLPGELSGRHALSWTRERQDREDPRLVLWPGRPDLEPAVGELPDRDTLNSALTLEYRWQQSVQPRQRVSRFLPAPLRSEQTAVHTERLTVENQLLVMDRAKTTATGVVPLRVVFEHQTLMGVSENLQVELALRTMGGVQERIEAGRSLYEPAWGLEARLEMILRF